MRILLVNQFIPPHHAPTARLLGDLGRHLAAVGYSVSYLAGRSEYGSTKKRFRLFRELLVHIQLIWKALWQPRAEMIIALTSPPCLLFTSWLIAKWNRARLVHWAMDVYPDVAEALGAIRRGGLVSKITHRAMTFAYRRCDWIVALDSQMQSVLERKTSATIYIQRPWAEDLTSTDSTSSKPFTWMYSGNLGLAHEWRALLEVQATLESRSLPLYLVFQGGGQCVAPAKTLAGELKLQQVEWRGYVDSDQLVDSLMNARVLVSTQRPETVGLLWPSKALLCHSIPRPFLWVGPNSSSISKLADAAFEANDTEAIANWLEDRFREEAPDSQIDLAPLRKEKEDSLEQWTSWIAQT